METAEGRDCLLSQSSVLVTSGFSPARVFPKDARFWVAATGDLRGHGLPASRYGKLLDLSVQGNSGLERDLFSLTGCPLGVMRLRADEC
jgi:hypothetical protein